MLRGQETPMPPSLDALLAGADTAFPATVQRLADWLRIPSVSAQPRHAADCARAAEWLAERLRAAGFTAEVRPSGGQPCVVAHHPGTGAAGPRLLYYGHYDVQPAEPFDLWNSPPFEPTIDAERITARGAVDDKGQVMTWLEAFRLWHEMAGGPPVPVTVLVEGEEEVGSPSLDAFLDAHRAELAADLVVISDTNAWDAATPAIRTRLRGLLYTEIALKAADRDLHSGLFGGSALNPLNLITRILGGLHDAEGRVQIPGFYDGLVMPSEAVRAQWASLGFDEAAYLDGIGLSVPSGERDHPALERLWARPTADINGLWGGYTGPGAKTVIASEAFAKLSFRLVPGQDEARIVEALRRFVAERCPPDAKVGVTVLSAAPAAVMDESGPVFAAARTALAAEYGRPAVIGGEAGSIPVVASFRRLLGLDSLLMGFGLPEDRIHSPNEKFDLACLRHGVRSHLRLLHALAG
jgi:acetylornithine deacetylase/succinyl-diaminopimelate desuccinylase-like protein